MKKYFLFFFFSFCIFHFSLSQNPLVKQWDYRFGGTSTEYFTSVQQTSDGGYILGGYTFSGIGGDKTQSTHGGLDYWIIKIDSLGSKQWDKDFGGSDDDYLNSLQQTTDGGYILGGFSFSDSSGDKTQNNWGVNITNYWIVKTDSLGNKQWDKRFGGISGEKLFSIHQTTDGGFILGGSSYSSIGGDKTQNRWDTIVSPASDYWIVKTDSLGNKQWDKRFGGTDNDGLTSLQQTSDGGFILGGFSKSDSSGDKTQGRWGTFFIKDDYWVVKTDSLGNKEWDKRFGGIDVDDLYSIQQTKDGGYILGGISASGITGDKTQPNWNTSGFPSGDYWIVKINSIGNKQWDKRFGGTDHDLLRSLQQTFDGGYILGGYSGSDSSGDKTENNLSSQQAWIVKIDSMGNKNWDKTIFMLGSADPSVTIQTKDGCYITGINTWADTGGYKTQFSRGQGDYWIIKFCDSTYHIGITPVSNSQFSISIFPNPAQNELTVTTPQSATGGQLKVFDIFGREIYSQRITTANCILRSANWSAGVYFVQVTSEKNIFTGKIIVQH